MKMYMARKTYLAMLVILSVLTISGCGELWDDGDNTVTTRPTVTSTDPYNAETDVPFNKAIAATFSEEMDASTITDENFTLSQGSTAITGVVTYSGVTAVFTPSGALSANRIYTATIKKAVKNTGWATRWL